MCSLKGSHTTFRKETRAGSMHAVVMSGDQHW